MTHVFSKKPKPDEGGAASRHPSKSTHPPSKEEDAGGNLSAQRSQKKDSGLSSQDLLQLQRTIGNQAMTNLTQGDKKDDDKDGEQDLFPQPDKRLRAGSQAFNLSNEQVLAELLRVAATESERKQGLIGAQPLRQGEGLLLNPCEMIHTRGLAISIDVVYIDDHDRVVGLDEKLPPDSEGSAYKDVHKVLELPAGTIRKTSTKVGDQLKF